MHRYVTYSLKVALADTLGRWSIVDAGRACSHTADNRRNTPHIKVHHLTGPTAATRTPTYTTIILTGESVA